MTIPIDKNKKHEEDTNYTDEVGGDEDDIFTKEDLLRVLNKATRKKDKKKGKRGD